MSNNRRLHLVPVHSRPRTDQRTAQVARTLWQAPGTGAARQHLHVARPRRHGARRVLDAVNAGVRFPRGARRAATATAPSGPVPPAAPGTEPPTAPHAGKARHRDRIPPWITLSLLDIPDVFIGSTGDGHTFVVVNRPIRAADRLLTEAGLVAREHHGRTLYLLPPGTNRDAREHAGGAMHGLLAHTLDLVDLAWTMHWSADRPVTDPDLRIQIDSGTVAVTAATATARTLLEQHGFTPTAPASSYRPPDGLDERRLLGAITAVEAHAYTNGLSVHVDLGIPTPASIPGRRPSAAATNSPPTSATRRRTH